MRYVCVCNRMGQDELMRISRALAMFRPSFISTMVSLTEEDLIYMEKCVQRTLMVRSHSRSCTCISHLTMKTGIREAYQLFRYTHSGLAEDRRDCTRGQGVFIAHPME